MTRLPVVFVHAFGGSLVHWADQLAHLRPGRRAIGFDLRGHGRSEATVGPDDTIEDLAGDIGAVVDGLRLERVVLVGHSIGGAAAVAYAGKRPQRVAGMLLVGTPGRVPLQQADQIMSQMTSDYDATMSGYWDRLLADATPRVKDQITSEMDRMPQDVAMTLIKATFAYDPLPALRDYPGIVETVTIGDSPYDLHKQAARRPRRARRRHEPLGPDGQARGVRPDPRRIPRQGRCGRHGRGAGSPRRPVGQPPPLTRGLPE